MKIVTLSDTHGFHDSIEVPHGDLILFAGDICMNGTLDEIKGFDTFLSRLPHAYKIVVAGNHDFPFQNEPELATDALRNAIYLQDSSIEINGIIIYGSPWQPWFYDWAFNLQRGEEIKRKWDLIPRKTDILVTHGPPFGILDDVNGLHQGCEELLNAIPRIRPQYHIFGHIHEGYGNHVKGGTTFINTSICDVHYRPINPPQIYEI